jgi:hypothetical protein
MRTVIRSEAGGDVAFGVNSSRKQLSFWSICHTQAAATKSLSISAQQKRCTSSGEACCSPSPNRVA